MADFLKTENEGTQAFFGDGGRLVNITLFIDYRVCVSRTGAVAKLPIAFAHKLDDGSEVERVDDDTFRVVSSGELLRTGL